VKKVLIIEAQMKQYRLPFYEMLYQRLRDAGIQLRVAYSDPSGQELQKRDNCILPLEFGLNAKASWLLNNRVLYQPLLGEIGAADLVITDHSYKLALTHYLLLLSRLGLKRVGFWGHGRNRQANTLQLREKYKKRTLNWVTWWFAYTAGTAEYLQRQGVPKSKITAVQNSTDTRRIQAHLRCLDADERARVRSAMGIPVAAPVGIFVGSLQKVKYVPFLLEASRAIRKSVSEFHLLIVGGGPEEEEIKESVRGQAWVHFLGSKFGDEKSELLAVADVFLLPGMVGLAILDAFAAGLPVITTHLPIHSPEVEYLEEARNGLMTLHDPERYAQAVTHLFAHPAELAALREGARHSAEKYSIENMVENFTEGIFQCLDHPKEKLAPPRGAEKNPQQEGARQQSYRETTRWQAPSNAKNLEAQGTAHLSPNLQLNKGRHGSLITTSWDDGHPLDLRVAELLAKSGLTGTFYVPRSSQKPVMSRSQIRELSKSFEIGAHTLEHVIIDRLSDAEAGVQLSGSREWIEELTGKCCRVFCFPGGKFRNRQLQLVRQAGYEAARTVELLSTASPRRVDDLCVIPTTVQVFPHGLYAYVKNSVKRFSAPAMLWPLRSLLSRDWLTLAKEVFQQTMERGGVFHLWGHSWEIEEQGQWENLEKFLMTVCQWRRQLRGVTNSELCAYAI
jgi:glycosyltransferase involved in cell wall biosynthesis/peptidoglycan/xylan/chitin deacetylase (PgdA/CDA1 family)